MKYWGKHENQIPANPSLSFTLDACHTQTEVILSEKKTSAEFEFEVLLDNEPKPEFEPKVQSFFNKIEDEASFLKKHHLSIRTTNSFPHSSGIASSASGMCALALCLLSLREQMENTSEDDFYRKASEWARLGSGSASRSVYGGVVEWGRFAGLTESSDSYAIQYPGEVHAAFRDYRDYVLLVEEGTKSVSSTAGHGLMKGHPYAERRFLQAHENLETLTRVLSEGDLSAFSGIVESEALTLHAMMMTSSPYFLLMKPNTVHIIERVWNFREETGHPLCFTLDAGANVHLLFPANVEPAVKEFVDTSLSGYLKNGNYICDQVGQGPRKLTT